MEDEVIRILREAKGKALKEVKNVKIVYVEIWKEAAKDYYYSLIANYVWKNQVDYCDLMEDLIVYPLAAQKACGVTLTDEGMELLDEMLVMDGFTSIEGATTKSYSIKPSIVENTINESNGKTKLIK